MAKLLLYCTKNPKKLLIKKDYGFIFDKWLIGEEQALNGKIVAECDYEVEDLKFGYCDFLEEQDDGRFYFTKTLNKNEVYEKSCLDINQLFNYLGEKGGYAIHIKNLNIFNKPRELSDYYKSNDYCKSWQPITKAPQNMMNAYDIDLEKGVYWKILISIRPEWLVKILNGEKKIEVRKKVLKEMK